jgi:hypothetical protein
MLHRHLTHDPQLPPTQASIATANENEEDW